tara:strand:- start:10255 stop:10623 length:369 start_codon:yes stop_codon:yes gene_type:complete
MINTKLKAVDFFFYTDGQYRNVSKWNSKLLTFDNDLKTDGAKIRIFGTEKQIDDALDKYCDKTGLNLDESYNYCVEPKGSYWNNILSITPEQNKKVSDRLKEYEELYNRLTSGSKAIVMNLI